MKKISRQPLPNALAAISAPPRIGPSTAEAPITGPNTANALPCSEGGEYLVDDAQALRDQQGGRRALGEPAADQHRGVDRERAGHRRGDKSERADDEQPLAAVDVAQTAAGDQAGGERERVATDDPLERGRAGVQIGVDRRRRDVDDRSVEQVHALGREHEREDLPPQRVAYAAG